MTNLYEVTFVYADTDEPESYINRVKAEDTFEAMKLTEQMFTPIIIMYVEEVK